MSWYEFLLFAHITAAVIWLGGAAVVLVSLTAAFLAPLRMTTSQSRSTATD